MSIISNASLTPNLYLRACRKDLVHPDGKPVLEIARRGDRRFLRLTEPSRAEEVGTVG